LHENGSLQESTWHLRHAAKQGHPTGMLLYALACRHGWGMRPNQREGVEWLRKAAESAKLEIADDENQAKEGKRVDVMESKTRKAQFALSVYELGVSHMNGWGIEQDKALALRCFEIAGCKCRSTADSGEYKTSNTLHCSLGRRRCSGRSRFLLCPRHRMQERPQEERQVLQGG
jgi:TPR repeat protein